MNSSYLNMAAGAFLGTVFVVMSVSILSETLFYSAAPEQEGFFIEVAEEEGAADAEVVESTPIATLLASADPSAGEGVFRRCASCHTVDEGGGHRTGPNLWDVVGSAIAHHNDYNYSAAMEAFSEGGAEVWDYDHLDGFLAAPRSYLSGTSMSFAGIPNDQDRANVIAYLRELSNDPAPLPDPEEATDPAAAEGEAVGAEEVAPEAGIEATPEDDASEEAAAPAEDEAEIAAPVEDAAPSEVATAAGPAVELLGEADAANGQAVFRRCMACHTVDEGGQNRVGPQLWDIVNRPIASADGFNYSGAMVEYSEGGQATWDYGRLDAYLLAPREEVPGTSMAFAGIPDHGDRADLILYLRDHASEPAPLPGEAAAPVDEAAAPAEEDAAAPVEEAAPAEGAAQVDDEVVPAEDEDAAAPAADAVGGERAAASGPAVALLADANPANGESTFRRCMACHTIDEDGVNRIGPNLWEIVDSPIASAEGFNYSAAMIEYSQDGQATWDYGRLDAYLLAPREEVPGTSMSFAGIRDHGDRADLLAYLRDQAGSPAPLPGEGAAPAEEAAPQVEEDAAAPAEGVPPAEDPAPAEDEDAAAPAEDTETELAAAGPAVALLGEADAANGQSVFRRCMACHTVDEGGANRVGPNLWDVVGNPIAAAEGFNYSGAMVEYSEDGQAIWDYGRLDAYLLAPRGEVPGTSMAFAGIPDHGDRADLILYLRDQAGEPAPLP